MLLRIDKKFINSYLYILSPLKTNFSITRSQKFLCPWSSLIKAKGTWFFYWVPFHEKQHQLNTRHDCLHNIILHSFYMLRYLKQEEGYLYESFHMWPPSFLLIVFSCNGQISAVAQPAEWILDSGNHTHTYSVGCGVGFCLCKKICSLKYSVQKPEIAVCCIFVLFS